jgi:hypothetical protein
MRIVLLALATLFLATNSAFSEEWKAAEIIPIRDCYNKQPCKGRDAIFFVHGVFGGADTFTNGSYQWPQELAKDFPDVDIFVITYHTQLLNWVKSDVATFDQIAEVLMSRMQGSLSEDGRFRDLFHGFVTEREYRSVGFIAHSLGGNVVAAYIHSVKSELGHVDRAQNAYLITLGTPADGAYIANVGSIINKFLHLEDPLLTSLKRDNLFLRMLAMWRRAEESKSVRFQCRPVHLFVGVEGASTFGVPVVSRASAEKPYKGFAQEIKTFPTYDHLRIAAPNSKEDPLNVWVTDIIKKERKRMDEWGNRPLCRSAF